MSEGNYYLQIATPSYVEKLNAAFPPPEDDPQQHQDSFSLQKSGKGKLYLMFLDEDVVGYVTLIYHHQHPRHPDIRGAFITGLHVSEDHWRRGLAAQLVNICEISAQNHTCPAIYLIVEVTNQPAIALYTKLGYQELPDKSFTLRVDMESKQVLQLSCYRKPLA